MVFWYFRTMFLRLVEGGELELCEAPSRCYTWLLVRSKANFNSDVSRPFTHAKRPPRQRLSCVLGMLSSLEVKVLCPT